METEAALEKKRSIRKTHLYATIAVWVTMLGSVGLYLLFVWMSVWRPHIAWWWLTAGLVVLSAVASLCLMIYQLFGRGRIRGIGMFMISVVPLVWLVSFLWSTITVLDAREDLALSAPIRALGLWVGSYFELEARWRYPRVTEGKHAILFDDGAASNVEALVADMDKHIEQMAATLETPIPKVKARWVRGSLFGQTGRAVGAWAIGNKSENVDHLEYVDFHEVAHVTLTTMCPVSQDMPMLLCEGWAQTQSADMAKAILRLSKSKKNGNALTLNEIVSQGYGRSTGPAYKYGGPLVMYLIEQFGGPMFVELYGGVRRKSFPQDVQRITGVSWDQLEEDFWAWLESRRQWAKKNTRETADASLFSFDHEQDNPLWQEILASARMASTSIEVPKNAAFVETSTSPSWNSETSYVFENDCMWRISHQKGEPSVTEFQIATPEASGYFVRKGNDVIHDSSWSSPPYKNETRNTKSNLFGYSRLSRLMMIDLDEFEASGEDLKIQIHSIQPQTDSQLWKFCFTSSSGSSDENLQKIEALLDSDHFFDVVEMTSQQNGSRRLHKLETNSIKGTPIVTRWTTSGNEKGDFTRTITALSAEDASQVKQEVEAAVAAAVEEPNPATVLESESWGEALLSPIALAIVWPSLGAMFLLIDLEVVRS